MRYLSALNLLMTITQPEMVGLCGQFDDFHLSSAGQTSCLVFNGWGNQSNAGL